MFVTRGKVSTSASAHNSTIHLYHTFHFEEAFQVVNLTDGHQY